MHNGTDISVSVTLTYFTAASMRQNCIEDFNSLARRMHLNPREPGHSAGVDTAKFAAMGLWAVGRRLRSAIVGAVYRDRPTPADGPGYRMEGS